MIRRISVTQNDIAGSLDPIREAVKRKLFPKYDVAIGVTGMQIFDDQDRMVGDPMPLPSDVIYFWHGYDTHKTLVPFKFLLDIPRVYLKGCSQDQELEE